MLIYSEKRIVRSALLYTCIQINECIELPDINNLLRFFCDVCDAGVTSMINWMEVGKYNVEEEFSWNLEVLFMAKFKKKLNF